MKKTIFLLVFTLFSLFGYAQVLFEGFENTAGPDPAPSTNWTLGSGNWAVFDTNVGGVNRWTINATSYAGTNCAFANRENVGAGITTEEYLVTPLVTVPNNGKLSFYSRTFTANDQNTMYEIKIAPASGSQTNPSSFTTLTAFVEPQLSTTYNIYEEKIIDLPSNLYGQQVYIAFVKVFTQPTAGIGGDRWYLDNVSIYEGCIQPTNILFTLTPSTISASWTNNNTSTAFEVAIELPTGSPFPTSPTTLINSNNYTFSNLTPGTQYVIFIKAICNSYTSDWIALLITTSICQPPTHFNATNVTTNSAVLGWAKNNSVNQWEYAVQLPSINTLPTSGTLTSDFFGNLVTNLTEDTTYNCYVRSICADNLPGEWGVYTFTTAIATPVCGGQFKDEGGINFNYLNNSSEVYTICPTNSGDVVTVSFTEFDVEPINDGLYIYNGTTANNTANQIFSGNLSNLVPGGVNGAFWGNTSIGSFTSTSTDGCLTFYLRTNATINGLGWLAEITCGPAPTCPKPISLLTQTSSPSSATLSWTETGSATQWEILFITPTNSTGTIFQSSTTSFELTNLIVDETYTASVRAICSSNDSSSWSNPRTFTFTPSMFANTTQYSDEQLISDILINNSCITVSNVTSSTGTNFGSANGIGFFTNVNSSFPLNSGIVLSTGNVLNIGGPNTSILSDGILEWMGDTDLNTIISSFTGQTMNSRNATKLEFDFMSLNEFMSFNFLFASEEYGYFQCQFSDAFAFLLTDLVSGVTTNLAVVPGTTTPISVVTIRDDAYNIGCPSANENYFAQYNDYFTSAINFNGQTVPMTASSAVLPNHPYHIKLVVVDRGDTLLDSAVFIEAGSFSAGPPQCFERVQLVAFIDTNNNGIKDIGEANFTYGSFGIQQNNTGPITSISSPIGNYTIYDSTTATYDFSYSVNTEYSPYYTASGVNYNDINIALNTNPVLYFPVTLTQGFNDVTVSISPLSQPRPGFNYTNRVTYKNLGVAATSGTLNFVKDTVTTIVSVSPSGTVTAPTGFSYNFVNLQPYESRSFDVTMSIPNIPTVNINDLLTTNATISAPANDINLTNNSFSNTEIVVASYDPNDITEAHGEEIPFNQFSANDYLYYTIRFQNTGTANAINVRLENTLDAQLDESSIRMVSASHNYVMERINNQLVWKFDYINLVSNLQSEELSKGYVTYKIKVQPGFAIGDIIPNTAEIYFDNNAAIVTNTFNTEFVASLGNASFESTDLLIFPNPANTTIQIQLQNTSEMIDLITITDVLGKTIRTVKGVSSNQLNVDVADLSQGVYFVEISTQNNLKQVKKLIKE